MEIIISAVSLTLLLLASVVYLFLSLARYAIVQIKYGDKGLVESVLIRLHTARTTPHYSYIIHGSYDKCEWCHIMVATKEKFDKKLCVQCYRR